MTLYLFTLIISAIKVVVDDSLSLCTAGGVEMLGLHATVAPRKQQQQAPPTLEEFRFVPYQQNSTSSNEKANDDIQNYLRLCKWYLAEIMKVLPQAATEKDMEELLNCGINGDGPSKLAEDLFQGNGKDHVLLKALMSVHSQIQQHGGESENAKEATKKEVGNDVDDHFLDFSSKEEVLKPCLDLVLENTMAAKLKIVEVVAEQPKLYKKVISLLMSQPTVEVDFTCALPKDAAANLDTEQLNGAGVKTASWDLEGAAPKDLSSVHLLIASNILHTKPNISEVLSNLMATMNDDSFLLIEEKTHNFAWSHCLSALRDQEHTELYTEDQWKEFFKDVGLEIVAQKSDNLLSSVFLLRKCKESTVPQDILRIDDLSFNWVEEVKGAIEQQGKKPKGQNLWLFVASQPCSGVVGMVNCLRREPGGQRIR